MRPMVAFVLLSLAYIFCCLMPCGHRNECNGIRVTRKNVKFKFALLLELFVTKHETAVTALHESLSDDLEAQ